ncbi:MAG: TM2 domain-containing protein [Firmicutes bacterium]|nr:TM2 domain-containing protein [Bacillota bacterium]
MAPRMPAVNPANQKSRLGVLLLAIFVGGWDVHNFYIGEHEKGIIKVIITIVCDILLFITGIILPILNLVFMLPVFGVHIWAIIEGICVMTGQVKTDAKGIPFKD